MNSNWVSRLFVWLEWTRWYQFDLQGLIQRYPQSTERLLVSFKRFLTHWVNYCFAKSKISITWILHNSLTNQLKRMLNVDLPCASEQQTQHGDFAICLLWMKVVLVTLIWYIKLGSHNPSFIDHITSLPYGCGWTGACPRWLWARGEGYPELVASQSQGTYNKQATIHSHIHTYTIWSLNYVFGMWAGVREIGENQYNQREVHNPLLWSMTAVATKQHLSLFLRGLVHWG